MGGVANACKKPGRGSESHTEHFVFYSEDGQTWQFAFDEHSPKSSKYRIGLDKLPLSNPYLGSHPARSRIGL